MNAKTGLFPKILLFKCVRNGPCSPQLAKIKSEKKIFIDLGFLLRKNFETFWDVSNKFEPNRAKNSREMAV